MLRQCWVVYYQKLSLHGMNKGVTINIPYNVVNITFIIGRYVSKYI